MTEEEIHKLCEKYKITNYCINSDMSIDVNQHVLLPMIHDKSVKALPTFGKVSGYFHYGTSSKTQIFNFKNCPHYVGGYFSCGVVRSSSLDGCPKYVGGDFYCENKRITSLDGLPVNFHIGGDFWSPVNSIKSAKDFGKLLFGHVVGEIKTQHDTINKFLNENKNPSKRDLPRLLSELRKITL